MKFKLGALLVIIIAGLLIVPPLLGRVNAQNADAQVVLQLENSYGISAGERQAIGQGEGAAPFEEDNSIMLPVRFVAESLGLTVSSQEGAIVLQDEAGNTNISLRVGDKTAVVNGEQTSVGDAPMLQNGMVFIPAQAAKAFGWNVYITEDADGAFIFIDTMKKTKEPEQKDIEQAVALLGPSNRQISQTSLIARAYAGEIQVAGGTTELAKTGDVYVSPVMPEEDIYLPLISIMEASGGTVAAAADGFTITTAAGDTETLKRDNTLEDGTPAFYQEEEIDYIHVQAFAKLLGLKYAQIGETVVVSPYALENHPDQLAYVEKAGQALAAQKLNIPDAIGYIALTFDDGPTGGSTGLTVQLLDGLKERGAHSTFFMCGYRLNDFHTHTDRYLAEGHEVANHTMDHSGLLTKMTQEEMRYQVAANNELIESYCGAAPTLMRPVGGAYNNAVLEEMKDLGLAVINWSVDTEDWKYRDAGRVKNVIVNQARDGDIVLLHDLYPTSVAGALAAIDELQAQGYAFVTVSQLAQIKGVAMEPGTVYKRLD